MAFRKMLAIQKQFMVFGIKFAVLDFGRIPKE